jgi:hypothetical protein
MWSSRGKSLPRGTSHFPRSPGGGEHSRLEGKAVPTVNCSVGLIHLGVARSGPKPSERRTIFVASSTRGLMGLMVASFFGMPATRAHRQAHSLPLAFGDHTGKWGLGPCIPSFILIYI